MKKRKNFLKFVVGAFLCVIAINVVVNNCFAGKFYPNGKSECLSSSGRSDIYSVQWACDKAVAKSQNACATWIGPTGSSSSTVITASSLTGVIPISYWGMCTDKEDTASALEVIYDNDSIADGQTNFSRSGSWGSPSSMGTTLNVAKFIQGAAIVNGMYYRRVYVGRCHSNYNVTRSCSADWSDIYLSVGTLPPPPVQESPETLCSRWAPSGFTSADMWHGTTTVEVKIRNLASRFGNTGYGDWSDGTIYAMPTDEVQWVECYYGGTPGTGQTWVASVNGGNRGYIDLNSEMCQSNRFGGSKPFDWNGRRYNGVVGAENYSVDDYLLYTKVQPWENKWKIYGDGQWRRSGDTYDKGWWYSNEFTNKSDAKRNGKLTEEGQAGSIFKESGETGNPQFVNIIGRNPEISIYKSYYETTEIDWSKPKSCVVGGISMTSGTYCGYETYQQPHYDGYSCTNGYEKNRYEKTIYDAYVVAGPHTDWAEVQIPYNFTTYTGVALEDGEVYAGETVRLSKVWTQVASKNNNVTRATYATQAPGAQLKLYAYITADENGGITGDSTDSNSNACSKLGSIAKQCREYNSSGELTLNGGGKLEGEYEEDPAGMRGEYDAFDASAGDYMCFVSLVYPASSGPDTQMGTGGDGYWRYSEPTCTVIAKRPTFQVWGGDMYSNSWIDARTSTKRNIFNAYQNLGETFTTRNGYGRNTFGSWVEEGLVLGGSAGTNNLTSGAATGNNGDAKRAYAGSSGNLNSSFNNSLSPLTISNYDGSYHVGSSGLYLDFDDAERRTMIDYWGNITQDTPSGARIEYYADNIIGPMNVPIHTTKIYNVDGDLMIVGDITYNDGYATLRDIPKMIIYADNVNISCSVTNVDAIIITKRGGTVNTCSDPRYGGSDDDPDRANPLKIFGMVITDNIALGRTYGRAAWKGSGPDGEQAAAEVFDFDSSILLWSEFMASSAETDTLQVVYQNEIAPRY